MRLTRWFSVSALALVLLGSGTLRAEPEKKPLKEEASFGVLRAPAPDVARSQAQAWLKGVGKTDATTQKAFDALWATNWPLLDKVAGTFALGNPAAATLLSSFKVPTRWLVLPRIDDVPTTPTGKVSPADLRNLLVERGRPR